MKQQTAELRFVNPEIVAKCATFSDVIHLTMQNSAEHRSYASWADLLGMRVSDFTCVVNSDYAKRTRHINPNKIPDLIRESGNLAILQWLEMAVNGQLNCQLEAIPESCSWTPVSGGLQ